MSVPEPATINSLNVISIPNPCHKDWNEMSGDDRVRHCRHCTKNVYNISKMNHDEAIELINQNEGKLCVRFIKRADGTIVTGDCPSDGHSGVSRPKRKLQVSILSLLILTSISAGLFASAPWIGRKIQPLVEHFFPNASSGVICQGEIMPINMPPIPTPAPNSRSTLIGEDE